MKTKLIYISILIIAFTTITTQQSCKKGQNDPVISLRTRKDRFTNTWTLTKMEKNGANQDISGSTYTYAVYNSGKLTQTIEGAVFGFPTRSVKDGSWEFVNDEEDVKITIDGSGKTYNVQRLAAKELWLKELSGVNTYVYYFEGN
ncbi:MAG: hypothetical protein H7296_00490 [Bacteroidia bacterium]|nr:hypothetical protein [Bacteroidia bacterium]